MGCSSFMGSLDRTASEAYPVAMTECPPHNFEQQDNLLLVCKRCGDIDMGLMGVALAVKAKLEMMSVEILDDSADDSVQRRRSPMLRFVRTAMALGSVFIAGGRSRRRRVRAARSEVRPSQPICGHADR